MESEQIEIIRNDWVRIRPNARLMARLFYTRLFLIAPSLRVMLASTVDEQAHRLMQVLDIAVHGLSQPGVLFPLLRHLGLSNRVCGIRPCHYEAVGKTLLWTLKIVLAESSTVKSQRAWSDMYGIMAGTMQGAPKAECPRSYGTLPLAA